MKAVVIGTVFLDIKGFPIGTFFPAGRNVGRVELFHGGVGRNIAEDVANLGAETVFLSMVEDDGMGEEALRRLKNSGVNVDYVRAAKDSMGTWLAIFDESGEVFANLSKRQNLLPLCEVMREHEAGIFRDADAIMLEIDIEEEVVDMVFRCAEKYEIPVYVVISNIRIAMERMEYIKRCSCFICNRQEAGLFFGLPEEDCREDGVLYQPEALQQLVSERTAEMGLNAMVVTMDADGAVFVDHGSHTVGRCPAEKVTVVNTTGAGDAFFAGTAAGLAQGKGLAEACRLGAHMSAQVISKEENVYKAENSCVFL